MWTEAGSEFGSEKGNAFLVVRAIYGMKASREYWTAKLADTLDSMGYRLSQQWKLIELRNIRLVLNMKNQDSHLWIKSK